jgi:hypothetical protein
VNKTLKSFFQFLSKDHFYRNKTIFFDISFTNRHHLSSVNPPIQYSIIISQTIFCSMFVISYVGWMRNFEKRNLAKRKFAKFLVHPSSQPRWTRSLLMLPIFRISYFFSIKKKFLSMFVLFLKLMF